MGDLHKVLVNSINLSKLREYTKLLFGFVCSIAFIVFIVTSIPVYIFRLFVTFLAKRIRPDLGEILNGQSSCMVNDLFDCKTPRSNIVVTIIIKGHLNLKEVKELVMKNWIQNYDKQTGELVFCKFQQYPIRWMGFTFYKNAFDSFNIDNHVFSHDSLPRGDHSRVTTEHDLNHFVEKLLNTPHPPYQSPWELHLVQNYKNEKLSGDNRQQDMSVLLFSTHHSLADGFSILTAIVDGFCEYPLSNVKFPLPRFPTRSPIEKVMNVFSFPFIALYELSYAMSNILRKSPWKIQDGQKDWYQVCAKFDLNSSTSRLFRLVCAKSDLIPVQNIKDIRNALGVSFTSVLLSAISATIWKNLQNKRMRGTASTRGSKNIIEDVDSMFCLSTLPVLGHTGRLTNRVTAAFFDIPCVKFTSSEHRLRRIDGMLERYKDTVLPYIARFYFNFIGWHFYPICRALFKNRAVSTGLTNFPSVPIQIEKNGKHGIVVDCASGVHDGVAGVGIMVLSYSGNIRIVVTAEKAVMSKEEAGEFVENIEKEINVLHKSTVEYLAPFCT